MLRVRIRLRSLGTLSVVFTLLALLTPAVSDAAKQSKAARGRAGCYEADASGRRPRLRIQRQT